jgi:hypothetical protein
MKVIYIELQEICVTIKGDVGFEVLRMVVIKELYLLG